MRGRDHIALGGCALTLAFAGLALGGATRWAAVATSLLALASAVPALGSRRAFAKRPLLLVLLAVAFGLTALQLVPLPAVVAGIVAPAKLALVTENARALGAPAPSWVMASYDPPATLVELAKLAGYLAMAYTALRISADRAGRRYLAMAAVGAAVLVGLVTLAHTALGLDAVYGVFTPPAHHPLLSPLLLDNHFASLMTLAVPVALVLAVTASGKGRALWLGAAVLCASLDLFSGSRGGAIGLAIGVIVTAAILFMQRRRDRAEHRRRGRITAPALVIGACIATLVVALTATRVLTELHSTSVERLADDPGWKIQTWRHSLPMLEDNAWLGTGRGAFDQAYARYSPIGYADFQYEENTYLQVIVDWGLPGGLAVLLIAAALAAAAARRWGQSRLEAGLLGALVALAAHDVVDFSLELPVIALVAIVLLAALVPGRLDSGSSNPPSRRTLWIRGGWLAVGIASCVVAATALGQNAHAASAEIEGTPTERLDLALAATSAHPADFLLWGKTAQAMLDLGDPRAVPVIARAIYLNPKHVGLHRLAAVMLLRAQRPQEAEAELAKAIDLGRWGEQSELVDALPATFPDPAQAVAALPLDPSAAPPIVSRLVSRHHEDLAFAYAQRLAQLDSDSATSHLLLAQAALATHRADVASSEAQRAYALHPDVPTAITLAKGLAGNGDATGAESAIQTALQKVAQDASDRVALLGTLADIQIAVGSLDAADATLDELTKDATSTNDLISAHLRRAELDDKRGQPNQAKWHRAEAQRLRNGDGS